MIIGHVKIFSTHANWIIRESLNVKTLEDLNTKSPVVYIEVCNTQTNGLTPVCFKGLNWYTTIYFTSKIKALEYISNSAYNKAERIVRPTQTLRVF